MRIKLSFIIFLFLFNSVILKTYNGYTVYKVQTKSDEDRKKLVSLVESLKGLDLWRIDEVSDIMAGPNIKGCFLKQLQAIPLNYSVFIDDITKKLKSTDSIDAPLDGCRRQKRQCSINFDRYYSFKEIIDYLDDLVLNYSNFTKLTTIGHTFEGRPLNILHLSTGNKGTGRKKPAIFIDGGIHAREWISIVQVLYIIRQLVENFNENSDLIDNIDWYLLPVVNPDGYEYSFKYDRFWRKTRSKISNSTTCVGVDANRNWDFHFDEYEYVRDPCGDNYSGPKVFSELETASIRNFVQNPDVKDNLKLYLTFHCYGTAILYSYADSQRAQPENKAQLHELATGMKQHLKRPYRVGNTPSILYYKAVGQSQDWFKDKLGVPLTYTIELPGGGEGGFDLPEDEILSVVSEMFNGVKYLAEYLINNYN